MKITIFYSILVAVFSVFSQPCHKDTLFANHAHEILTYFSQHQIHLDSIAKTKKIINLNGMSFPKDFKDISHKQRKTIFFQYTLSALIRTNNEILAHRAKVNDLYQNKNTWLRIDSVYVDSLMSKYYAKNYSDLLLRMDVLPPSLVIAQAIDESGWGTSFFSMKANSIFGMKAPRKTKMPTIKHPKYNFVTYKFESLGQGLDEYVLNLNRNPVYKQMWILRAKQREKNQIVKGEKIVAGISRYSSQGYRYINIIKKHMKSYDLHIYDEVSFKEGHHITISPY
ncbi:MAG: glucosaminidase domain-containing protein [Cytophagales bacterium]